MSKPSFKTPLVVSPLPDGRRWRLVYSFQYLTDVLGEGVCISIKEGFVTDFASIPKFLWFLPYWVKYSKPSIIHDWLYQNKSIAGRPITRLEADLIFYESMLRDWNKHKSRNFMAGLLYWAVTLFGWLAWKKRG